MPSEKKVNCEECQDTGVYDYQGFSMDICMKCNDNPTVKPRLTAEPVSNRYKFKDGEIHLCWACGALPCDGGLQAWESLPWIATLAESGNWRFLIDRRDSINPDMFSGFKIDGNGSIGVGISQMSGNGGRINLHRSYFLEDLPP